MHPVFHLFGSEIPSYTLMILIGFGAGYASVARRGDKYGVRPDETAAVYLLAAVGAFVGGKTFYILQGLPEFFERSARGEMTFFEYISQAGLVFYGGLLGCLFAIWLSSKAFRTPFYDDLDTVLPGLPLAQSFGRVGCFLVGCCYGMPSEFGIDMSASDIAPHMRLFPIQLAESACTLVLFFLLLHVGKKKRRPGYLLGLYLCGYGASRFILEFFRYDEARGRIGALSVSQWISIAICVWGTYLLCRVRAQSRKPGPVTNAS